MMQVNDCAELYIFEYSVVIGIEMDYLDDTWLSIMDSFGAARGNITHNSIGVQLTLDRSAELDRIKNQILPGIISLDIIIEKLH